MSNHVVSPAVCPPYHHRTRPARYRRASKACLSCRSRKVRCDATSRHPNQCTNCLLDGVACVVPSKRQARKKKPHQPHLEAEQPVLHGSGSLSADNPFGYAAIHSPTLTNDTPATNIDPNIDPNILSLEDFLVMDDSSPFFATAGDLTMNNSTVGNHAHPSHAQVTPPSSGASPNVEPDLDTQFDNFPTHHDDTMGNILNISDPTKEQSYPAPPELTSPDESPYIASPSTTTLGTRPDRSECSCCPPCIPTVPWLAPWCRRDLDRKTARKIANAGACSTPSSETINCLLEYFFRFKHPRLPVLSEREVDCLVNSRRVRENGMAQPMSLALFYAIMCSASCLVTKEEALLAGFSSVREMRRAFYTRAKILYHAGCEQGPMQKVQFCILMSGGTHELRESGIPRTEYWVVEAQAVLKAANIPTILAQDSQRSRRLVRWRVLYACCVSRVVTLLLGTQRLHVHSGLPLEIPEISLGDFSDELREPWFLGVALKHRLAELFLAKMDLFRRIIPICSVIIQHTNQRNASASTEFGTGKPYRRSIIGDLEECEGTVAEWQARYHHFLEEQPEEASQSSSVDLTWLIHISFFKLTYEFIVSTVHQISLTFGSTKITTWSSKVREASHQALWESATATTDIIQQLILREALRYLPSAAIVCIFVPFTMHGVLSKASILSYAPTVHGLSTCLKALQELSERYDEVDYFLGLHHTTLTFVHQLILRESIQVSSQAKFHAGDMSRVVQNLQGSGATSPLGETEAYSQVLKLHARIKSEGRLDMLPQGRVETMV